MIKVLKSNKLYLAITCALLAYVMVPVVSMLNKILIGQHHVLEVSFYRNIFALLPIAVYMICERKPGLLRVQKPAAVVFRCSVALSGFVLTMIVSRILPLSTTTVFTFLSPLLVPVLAVFFLKERTGWQRMIAISVGMIGVLIAAKPSPDVPLLGVVLGFFMGLMYALSPIMMRYLRDENPLVLNLYVFAFGAVICSASLPFVATLPSLENLAIMAAMGAFSLGVQYLTTLAFKLAPASLISPFIYTSLIWSALFDAFIWGVLPESNVWIGAAIIAAATIFITYRESINDRRAAINASHSHSR